jgi:hypothetical protein
MKVPLSTSVTLFAAAASCATLMACANNTKEATAIARPQSLLSTPEPGDTTAAQVGHMPEGGDNTLRNKMYNMFLYALSN